MKTGVSDGSIGMVPCGVFGAKAGVVAGAAKDGVSGDLEGGRSSGSGSGSGIKDGLSGGGKVVVSGWKDGLSGCLVKGRFVYYSMSVSKIRNKMPHIFY